MILGKSTARLFSAFGAALLLALSPQAALAQAAAAPAATAPTSAASQPAAATEAAPAADKLGAQAAGALRIHQHPRALQVVCAVAPGRKHEVPFEQGMAGAELCEDLVVGHVVRQSLDSMPPTKPCGPVEKSP